jgi:hypothetical protein
MSFNVTTPFYLTLLCGMNESHMAHEQANTQVKAGVVDDSRSIHTIEVFESTAPVCYLLQLTLASLRARCLESPYF